MKEFDPEHGCQETSTGLLGAGLMLGLIVALGFLLPAGNPKVLRPFDFLPAPFRWDFVYRDFFDLVMVVALGFLWMATWELRRSWRPATLIVASLTLLSALQVVLGWPWLLPRPPGWSDFEAVLATSAALLGMIWLPEALLPRPRAPLGWVLRTSFWRWGAGLIAFTAVLLIAFGHPYYLGDYFANWRLVCLVLFCAYVTLGLPYAVAINLRGASLKDNCLDPGFMLLLVYRRALSPRKLRTLLRSRRTRTLARDLLVKLFFIPLMVVFFFGNCGSLYQNLPVNGPIRDFQQVFGCLFWSLLVVDVSLSLVGYCGSSRWLGNKSVSVESTLLGWAVALACYPPFNNVSGELLPYSRTIGTPWLQDSPLFQVAVLILMGLYVYATTAFGLRFSNLTNRGIITRGPYRWIRHPAYTCKNLAWWFESLPAMGSIWQVLFLVAWNGVYIARALTEERHLMHDPGYRAYCRLVRWRFIPGLI